MVLHHGHWHSLECRLIDDLFDDDSQDELIDFFNELESDDIQLVLDEFEDEYEEDDLKLFRLYHYCETAF